MYNKEKKKQYAKKYYEKNKEKIYEQQKEWRKNNKEKLSQYSSKYRKIRIERMRQEGILNPWGVVMRGSKPKYMKEN